MGLLRRLQGQALRIPRNNFLKRSDVLRTPRKNSWLSSLQYAHCDVGSSGRFRRRRSRRGRPNKIMGILCDTNADIYIYILYLLIYAHAVSVVSPSHLAIWGACRSGRATSDGCEERFLPHNILSDPTTASQVRLSMVTMLPDGWVRFGPAWPGLNDGAPAKSLIVSSCLCGKGFGGPTKFPC